MPKTALSPAERDARRKERARRSFSDAAYRHYDPRREGFGSVDEWIATATAAASGLGGFRRVEGTRSAPKADRNLVELGLSEMPAGIAGVKGAFRRRLFEVHPDHGGTEAATIALKKAYDALLEHYQ